MFSVESHLPSRLATALRVSAVALLAAGAAGCSSGIVRLSDPVFTGSTANQQRLLAQAGGTAAPMASPVVAPPQNYALSSPRPTVVRQAMPTALPPAASAPMPAVAAMPSSPPSTAYAAKGLPKPVAIVPSRPMVAPVAGRVLAPAAYAEATGTPPAVAATDLPKDYRPSGAPRELGQLVIPRERPSRPRAVAVASIAPTAPVVAPPPKRTRAGEPSAAAPRRAAPGGTYTVQPGDSLWTIAKRTGTTTKDLIAANGLTNPAVSPGMTLKVPSGGVAVARAAAPSAAPAPVPTASLPVVAEAPRPVPEPAAPPPAAAPVAPAPTPVVVEAEADRDTGAGFRWPVRGRVIAGFGKRGSGERNDGINLAVPEGTPVRAAEAGTVIYAGSELKNYGQLILVRHPNGFVSAYAHNGSLKVKRGEKVGRGAVIATSGKTGDVSSPQLHFELRKGATPVNPLDYLAG